MELKEKIQNRINDLSEEIEKLVTEREDCNERIHEINVRIAHIVGAIQELDALDKGEEKNDV